jgi:hypothetical protein
MSIVERPRYDKKNPKYAIDITEVVCQVIANYDVSSTPTSSTLFDLTYEPDWKQPPDALVRYTIADYEEVLENSWSREGCNLTKASLTIDSDGLNYVMSRTMFKAPDSVKSIKVTNPWPYPTYYEVKSWQTDGSTEVGEIIAGWCSPGGTSGDIDVVDKIKADLLNSAEYVGVEHYWFRSGDPLNVMLQNSDDDGFVLPYAGKDPRNGKPFFGAVGIDSYNFIEKYGLLAIAAGGVADLAGAFANETGILQATPGVRGLANKYGIDITQVAAILGMGMYFEWIDEDALLEHLIPALAAGFADKAVGWAVQQMPDKYTQSISLLGGRISAGDIAGAGAGAAAMLLYLRMMDDVALHVEF